MTSKNDLKKCFVYGPNNDLDWERGTKLLDALLRNRPEEAINILKEGGSVDFDIVNKGDYVIHLAARRGDVDVIKAMLDKGVDLEQKNLAKNVPMHYAAKCGYLDLVRFLTKNGAKPNAKNMDGECPLHEAVKTQTMDIVEALVDIGMDPNVRNKDGEMPLHTALKFGAREAMEALLIKKANPDVTDTAGRKPKDVAKNSTIRESLQMYASMMSAMQSGNIKAKGLKINRHDVTKPTKIDRVGIIIEYIDIPKEFPAGFYCRREKAENATIKLPSHDEESVFSDVFHIRIFEANRDCPTKISLPIYTAPSNKEQLVLRIINEENEVKVVDTYETKDQIYYCMLETTLIPETTCVCLIYVRPKKEDNKLTEEGATITSEIEKDFSLDVPAGSFEGETVLSLTVFETNAENEFIEEDDDLEDGASKSESKNVTENPNAERVAETESDNDNTIDNKTAEADITESNQTEKTKQVDEKSANIIQNTNLVTDVYQINIAGMTVRIKYVDTNGQQPKKGIKVQIPLCKGMDPNDEIAIIHADENNLGTDSSLEVLPIQPQVVGMNLVFEVTQFCIYVASWKKQACSKEEKQELGRQISMIRDKRKPAALFAVIKQVEGLRHIMVVECVVANKSNERRSRWLEKESYEIQDPPEASGIMMSPGDSFYVNIEGNAYLEDQSDSTERKLQFSQVRASWQAYHVVLKKNIYDPDKAVGYAVVSKMTDRGLEESARLRIKLSAPPLPPVEQSPSHVDQFKESPKPCEEEIEAAVQETTVKPIIELWPSMLQRSRSSSRQETANPGSEKYSIAHKQYGAIGDRLKQTYKVFESGRTSRGSTTSQDSKDSTASSGKSVGKKNKLEKPEKKGKRF